MAISYISLSLCLYNFYLAVIRQFCVNANLLIDLIIDFLINHAILANVIGLQECRWQHSHNLSL